MASLPVSNDWLTDTIIQRWMREWVIDTQYQPEYGENPYQCVATNIRDATKEVAAQHIDQWGAIKAACTLCVIRGLWELPKINLN